MIFRCLMSKWWSCILNGRIDSLEKFKEKIPYLRSQLKNEGMSCHGIPHCWSKKFHCSSMFSFFWFERGYSYLSLTVNFILLQEKIPYLDCLFTYFQILSVKFTTSLLIGQRRRWVLNHWFWGCLVFVFFSFHFFVLSFRCFFICLALVFHVFIWLVRY